MTEPIPARLRGVYYLYRDAQIVYVGSSSNILRRVSQHVTDDTKDFDSFSYHDMSNHSQWDIESFEIIEIKRLKPQLNVTYNGQHLASRPMLASRGSEVKDGLCRDCGSLRLLKGYYVCRPCMMRRRENNPHSFHQASEPGISD